MDRSRNKPSTLILQTEKHFIYTLAQNLFSLILKILETLRFLTAKSMALQTKQVIALCQLKKLTKTLGPASVVKIEEDNRKHLLNIHSVCSDEEGSPLASSKCQKEDQDNEKQKKSSQAKRKFWLPSEDSQLIELVNLYGEKWSQIASMMQGRTGKQIRDRYINSLKPGIRQEAWTKKEDDLLLKLYKKIGNKWSRIAWYLKGRTENQVKNRFRTYSKKNQDRTLRRNKDFDSDNNFELAESTKRRFVPDLDFDVSLENNMIGNGRGYQNNPFTYQEEGAFPLHLQLDRYNQFTAPKKLIRREENKPQRPVWINQDDRFNSWIQKGIDIGRINHIGAPILIRVPHHYEHGNIIYSDIYQDVENCNRNSLWSLQGFPREESVDEYIKEEYINVKSECDVKEEYSNVKYESV